MRLTRQAFLDCPHKRVTLLGMSGVGKTRLASILRDAGWFHYSVDYRIGTRYLDEPILDNIKRQAMQVPFLKDLLLSDSIYISNNITVDHLKPLSTFLGMLGNPELGGLSLDEFRRRQHLHLDAERRAMADVSEFIDKSASIYGYPHFLNDVSGSFCEIDDDALVSRIAEDTLMIYIEADRDDQQFLIDRAQKDPKPLYYRDAFLDEHLELYRQAFNVDYIAEIDPRHFVTWVFPYLFHSRLPRYQAIADTYGYRIAARDALRVDSPEAFVELVADALD